MDLVAKYTTKILSANDLYCQISCHKHDGGLGPLIAHCRQSNLIKRMMIFGSIQSDSSNYRNTTLGQFKPFIDWKLMTAIGK